jgi:hypothetical protein
MRRTYRRHQRAAPADIEAVAASPGAHAAMKTSAED